MALRSTNKETIAAISTAVVAGQGGIAVIRISGQEANAVGQNVVAIPGGQSWKSHTVLYGHVIDEESKERIDEVLVLIMGAPRSFTGEDVVEIHCHGGLIAVQRVLTRVLSHPGVRRALPGEFSQRAVLNGRLNLTQAEAISDLIAAKSNRAAQLAISGMDGGIHQRITSLREKLLDQLSELEARVDFEDELPPLNGFNVLNEILQVQYSLEELINDANRACFFRQGIRVAIIGRPNVGKSSLLNRLSRRELAIVTEQPGTTRDLLENEIVLEGMPITFLDTAGVRETIDEVEKLGIAKTHQALSTADVVVLVFDLTLGWTKGDQTLLEQIPKEIPKILLANKADIAPSSKIDPLLGEAVITKSDVVFSALTGEGEGDLVDQLLQKCGACESQGLVIALNERQRDLAVSAAKALQRTQKLAEEKLPWDFWTIDLREAIHNLAEITGEEITDTLLDRIFSRFCIGK